jgi:hypothetical protein
MRAIDPSASILASSTCPPGGALTAAAHPSHRSARERAQGAPARTLFCFHTGGYGSSIGGHAVGYLRADRERVRDHLRKRMHVGRWPRRPPSAVADGVAGGEAATNARRDGATTGAA